jgi:hypothetical protein
MVGLRPTLRCLRCFFAPESLNLARSSWYYEKKRGNRRTGSPIRASVGEALFFAVFLAMGCAGMVMMLSDVVLPEWRVNHEFVETTCKVVDKRISEKQGEDGPLYRPDIKIEYDVGIVTYSDWHYDIHRAYSSGRENAQAVLDQFAVYDKTKDNRYTCWYDPVNPRLAVLVREYRWWLWLLFTVPVSFVVLGAGGLIYALLHWGKSAERRAAMTQRTQERDFFGVGGDQPSYPSIPPGVDMTNSPGTRLRFRLPMATSPGWAVFGTLAACVFWNGLVSVFVTIAIRSHLAGRPEWLLTFFIIPFVLVGFWLIYAFIRQLLVATGIGPTLMEISDHPLRPGGQYRVFLLQSGRLMMRRLSVSLECEESATYRQGTNTRTETQVVYRQEIFRREAFVVENGMPFEAEMELNVPDGAMHSFKSEHNEINWVLTMDGKAAKWPSYKRSFPLIIRPAGGDQRP